MSPPDGSSAGRTAATAPASRVGIDAELLAVEALSVHFPVARGGVLRQRLGTIKAVDGVSLSIRRGETLGLVGESGCGKSTLGLAVTRMVAPTAWRVVFDGEDLATHDAATMRALRGRMQMVFQDPYGSLNPRMTVRDIVGEPLQVHRRAPDRVAYRQRVAALLAMVGLTPAMADRYPHEFSGGQRQRINIARAIALEPALLVCDEPVSALDVSIQAQVINLFVELQQRLGLTYLFIAHDLGVVRHVSDRIAVMYLGQVIELGGWQAVSDAPLHPYTRSLRDAVPVPDPELESQRLVTTLRGEVPDALNPPAGCRFNPRCPHAEDRCETEVPPLREITQRHEAACHFSEQLYPEARGLLSS